nr:hypothetical protein [Lachnospiraceae bacterium]
IYFGIFFGSWILYLIACNPGNISQDAASAWSEIIGDRKISSLFPPLIKIFYRLITRVIPSIYVIAVTQILMMSLIAASFVMFLHRRGVSPKKLIPGSLLFALFPPNGIFVVTFSSNFYYMVSMCLLTFCIIRFFAEEEETVHSRIYPVLLGLSLYGLYFMRNEGRYICIFFLILMAILSVKMKNLKWGMSSVGTVVVILLTNFVIFPAFGTGSGEMQSFDYWRNMLWSAAYYGGELPEQAESYYGNYEKFTEGDFSYDGCPPEKPEILSHDERMDAVSYVLEHDFPEVLRDRLNKSDVVWDVTEAVSAHNVREITMVVPTSYGFERHENILTKIFVKALYPVTIAVAPLDCLCYRSGIWIDAALLLILGFCVTRRKRCILTLLPALVHSAVFIFGLLWQCSRHVYVTELCVLMVLISAPFLMSGGKSRK